MKEVYSVLAPGIPNSMQGNSRPLLTGKDVYCLKQNHNHVFVCI